MAATAGATVGLAAPGMRSALAASVVTVRRRIVRRYQRRRRLPRPLRTAIRSAEAGHTPTLRAPLAARRPRRAAPRARARAGRAGRRRARAAPAARRQRRGPVRARRRAPPPRRRAGGRSAPRAGPAGGRSAPPARAPIRRSSTTCSADESGKRNIRSVRCRSSPGVCGPRSIVTASTACSSGSDLQRLVEQVAELGGAAAVVAGEPREAAACQAVRARRGSSPRRTHDGVAVGGLVAGGSAGR